MYQNNKVLISKHSKSFYWASFFLSQKIFLQFSTVYNFCRTLDDIADNNHPTHIKKKKFKEFKNFFYKDKSIYIVNDFKKLIQEYDIKQKIVSDLFDGIESDLKKKVIFTKKKDLYLYSYRVAGTVGLIISKILKIKDKNVFKGAIKLGIAMQLTNIARDVMEDSKNNRFYISKSFNSIKKTIHIAENLYDESFWAIKHIPLRQRFAILVARKIYRQIGYEILKRKNMKNYIVSGKIYVSNMMKLYLTIKSIIDLIKLFFIKARNLSFVENKLFKFINLHERI
ncbi:MAG: squalene/phytoene synthase family protein [Pelagibacteraceae bacterium]